MFMLKISIYISHLSDIISTNKINLLYYNIITCIDININLLILLLLYIMIFKYYIKPSRITS